MSVASETSEITSADGHRVRARCLAPEPAASPARAVLLFMPAMGVEADYYRGFVESLAAAGYHVVAPALRGARGSSLPVARDSDFGYRELLTLDWPAAVTFARARAPGLPLVLIGHSLGGQLHCVFQSRALRGLAGDVAPADALVMLACCSAHVTGYPAAQRPFVWAGARVVELVARGLGHYPGHRLGFGGRQPSRLMLDWAREARRGRYVIDGDPTDYAAALSAVRTPGLSISFDGDRFAPRGAVDALCARLGPGSVDRVHVGADALGLPRVDHFRWVRAPRAVAGHVDGWLREVFSGGPGVDSDAPVDR